MLLPILKWHYYYYCCYCHYYSSCVQYTGKPRDAEWRLLFARARGTGIASTITEATTCSVFAGRCEKKTSSLQIVRPPLPAPRRPCSETQAGSNCKQPCLKYNKAVLHSSTVVNKRGLLFHSCTGLSLSLVLQYTRNRRWATSVVC